MRLTRTADGGVKLERTPVLPSPQWKLLGEQATTWLQGCQKLRPRELAVVNENDLWLTAQCFNDQDYAPTVLLHTQEQKPLLTFKSFDRSPAGVR